MQRRQIKIRHIFFRRAVKFLRKSVLQSCVEKHLRCPIVLVFGYTSRQYRVINHVRRWEILSHKRNVHRIVNRRYILQNPSRIFERARQNEVSYNDPFFHHSVVVENVLGLLTAHFFYRFYGNFSIPFCVRIFPRQIVVGILKIGQINIHQTFEFFEILHGFVSATVPHNRYFKLSFCNFKRVFEQIRVIGRRNEIYVVRAYFLKIKHKRNKFALAHFESFALVRNLVVLAEQTAQIAPRKEDSSATPLARQTRFFEMMQSDSGNLVHNTLLCAVISPVRRRYSSLENGLAHDRIRLRLP